jgi:adenine-specific DNA-methyltransferase
MIVEIPLQSIYLEDRQRREYGDLEGLAASIRKYGQFQNILVKQNGDGRYRLVAGGRRLAGLAAAGKTTAIAKLWEGEADELLLEELELEENVQRKELTWQERQDAIAKMHRIKQTQAKAEGREWTVDQSATLLGMAKRTIYNAIELSEAVKNDPEIAKADTAFGAMQRLTRSKDLRKRQDAVQVRELAETIGMAKPRKVKVVGGDALEVMSSLPPASMDYVITNPPYGVDIEKIFTSDKKIYGIDDEATISTFCAKLFKEAFRVLKDDRWFVTFYPTRRLEECREFLSDAGFVYQAVPSIWVKPNKYMSSVNDPYVQLGIRYESFFFARKGNAKYHVMPKNGNVFIFDTPKSDRIHPLQMPPELWSAIFELITIRGEVGVEPCSGSGSGGIAAIERDLEYTGIELDPEYVARSNTWIQETITGSTSSPIEIDNDAEVVF